MKTKIEIKSIFGDLLFSYEKEENTIKDTLEEAIKAGVNLRYANLGNADLVNANLGNADLRYANLRYANLVNADLGNADLRYANLGNADLRYANLGDWGSVQSCTDILFVTPIGSRNGCTTFFHTNKGVFVKCGCFSGTIEEFADKVKETHGDNEHARDYLALVEFVKVKYNVDK